MATKRLTRAERNAAWIEQHCRVPEGRLVGKPIKLTKEQLRWLRMIYDEPTRRFILSMGRKNAKTATCAFLLLLHLVGPEAKPNSQLFSAAQSRDQAAILFALAAKMVRMSPDLSQYVVIRDTAKQLACPELGTLYRALSADASTAFGLSPAVIVHDELGQVRGPRSELYEALETAAAAQESPLSLIISTQAPTDADLLSILIDDALGLKNKEKRDKSTKVALYTADVDLDPFSEKAIRQANPHFDVLMNQDEVRNQAETAKRMPSAEAAYRNLVLNQRVNTANPFIAESSWEACAGEVNESLFTGGAVVYGGLDLSARNDLTAKVWVAQDEDGVWHVKPEFFAPRVGVEERTRRDKSPYDVWASQGLITLTPGASIEYSAVAESLVTDCDAYQVAQIAFDRWRIDVLRSELARLNAELPLVEFGQGFKDMAPALDALESIVANGKLRHGGHPVLRMCALNAIAVKDPAGNRKLDKSKPTGRIDGLVALAMAIGAASRASQVEKKPLQIFMVG